VGLSDLPMIGVAKGEERKAGLEQLFSPTATNRCDWRRTTRDCT
jgi:hypothetical protein